MIRSIVHSLQSIVLLLLLSGCSESFLFTKYDIEADLQVYVDRFHHEAELRGIYIIRANLIAATQHDLGSIGLYRKKNGQRHIFIDRKYFDNHNDEAIEWAVFHELGHALLKRLHTDTDISIMNINRVSYRGASREEFIDELFNP